LSGPVADGSKSGYQGYQLWRDTVNAAGGVIGRKVEFVILDDGFDQNTVVSNYNRLISQDKVDLLIGTFSSFLNLPASAIAERHGMVYVEPSGGAAELFNRGLKRLFFTQAGTTERVPDRFLEYLTSLPAGQRPATAAYPTLNDPSADVPVGIFKTKLEALGIRTVFSKTYPAETTSFDAMASTIADAKPDLVIHGALDTDGIAMIRSFEKIGFSPKFLFQTKAPSSTTTFPTAVGAKNTEGIFTAAAWHPKSANPGNAAYVQAYQKKFGTASDEDAAASYTAGQVLQAAVQAVGKIDQAAIATWLHRNSVQTILGKLSWDSRGVPQGSLLLVQWQNGQLQVISPAAAATTKAVVRPKPAWVG
jgi:branched-chain amino acid transport system substrate-binding protein